MDDINGLLIIASALSVFCQYIDNYHRAEINAAKEEVKNIDYKGSVSSNIKKSIDDFTNSDCLRMKQNVMHLFILLLTVIIVITLFNFANALSFVNDFSWWLEHGRDETFTAFATAAFGLCLTAEAWLIRKQYKAMQQEKTDTANRVEGYKDIKESVDEVLAKMKPPAAES